MGKAGRIRSATNVRQQRSTRHDDRSQSSGCFVLVIPTLAAPEVPKVVDHDHWTSTSLDFFILDQLNKEKLTPSSRADRETLIRRLHYDLTGLPPSVESIKDFVGDLIPMHGANLSTISWINQSLVNVGEGIGLMWFVLLNPAVVDGRYFFRMLGGTEIT